MNTIPERGPNGERPPSESALMRKCAKTRLAHVQESTLGESIFETGDVVSHDRQTSSKVAQTPRASRWAHVNDVLEALTLKEREVLDWLPKGFSAKEIAGKMNISPRTVEKHIENIKRRLFGHGCHGIGLNRLTVFACTCSESNMRQAFRTARELVNA